MSVDIQHDSPPPPAVHFKQMFFAEVLLAKVVLILGDVDDR